MTHSWIRTLQYGNISPTTSNTTTTASTTNLRKGFSSSNKYTTNPADAGGAGAGAGSTSDNIESNNDINDTTNENGPTAAKAQFRAAAKDLIQHIRDTKNATESDNPRFMDEIEATLNSQDFAFLLWNKKTDFQKFQRIEFLGERALRTVIARMLYERYPEEREGYLAKRCNALLSRETCSDIAQKKELRNYLTIALGEKPSFNPSILHSAMEALIGALYLDWGLEPAASFIHCYWATLLEQPVVIPPTSHKNTLQELAQSMTLGINPVYETLEHSGCDSASRFKVRVTLGGIGTAMGTGSTKRDAEQRAARTLLHEIINLETPLEKPVGPPPNKNPKNALQEHAQSIPLRSRPVYETLKQSGPSNAPSFKVRVTLEGVGTAKGTGSSKRDAEYMAARTLLAEIMNLETPLENQAVVLPPHDKGPKTTLQEFGKPVFETLERSGPIDAPTMFKVRVTMKCLGATGVGTGSTKRKAEQMAARTLLAEIMNLETPLEKQAVVLPPHDNSPKTTLQELGNPVYEILELSGPIHAPMFKVRVTMKCLGATSVGTGSTKRAAEQMAARTLLDEVMKRRDALPHRRP